MEGLPRVLGAPFTVAFYSVVPRVTCAPVVHLAHACVSFEVSRVLETLGAPGVVPGRRALPTSGQRFSPTNFDGNFQVDVWAGRCGCVLVEFPRNSGLGAGSGESLAPTSAPETDACSGVQPFRRSLCLSVRWTRVQQVGRKCTTLGSHCVVVSQAAIFFCVQRCQLEPLVRW